jgi:hypothetical protein
MASVSARLSVAGKNCITRGSAFKLTNGSTSLDCHPRRIKRSVSIFVSAIETSKERSLQSLAMQSVFHRQTRLGLLEVQNSGSFAGKYSIASLEANQAIPVKERSRALINALSKTVQQQLSLVSIVMVHSSAARRSPASRETRSHCPHLVRRAIHRDSGNIVRAV